MFRILYLSTANQSFSSEDLPELLRKARAQNDAVRVTGMLVYSDGDFLQVLEGEPENVMESTIVSTSTGGTVISACFSEALDMGTGCFRTGQWASSAPDQTLVDEVVGVNGRVKLRYLDAMSALEFLLACSRSQT